MIVHGEDKGWLPSIEQRMVLVDDHSVVRGGLRRLLEMDKQYGVIEEADSAEQLISLCKKNLPALIILDLSMPGMGGLEGTRRLKLKWPELKIIIFSIYQNSQLVRRALANGACGYITKSSSSDVILKCISKVMMGEFFVSPDLNEAVLPGLKQMPPRKIDKLSSKELSIFGKLAEGLGIEKISSDLFISEKTVANNISIIKKKLGVSSTAEIVHIAINEGMLAVVQHKNDFSNV